MKIISHLICNRFGPVAFFGCRSGVGQLNLEFNFMLIDSESETFYKVCCTSCNKVLELTDSGAWCAECVNACDNLLNKNNHSSSEVVQLRRMGMEFSCSPNGNFSWQ